MVAVLELRDYDLAVRCLEVVRSHLAAILPADVQYRVEVIPLCHRHRQLLPSLGVFGAMTWAEVANADVRINDWVADRGLAWLVAESVAIAAPSWANVRARQTTPNQTLQQPSASDLFRKIRACKQE